MKSIKDLISSLENVKVLGSQHTTVFDITNDSRQVHQGSLFIAVPGYSVDGHKYIEKAVAAGAAAIVAERAMDLPVPQIIVPSSRHAQAVIACEFFDHPSRDLIITGVTGTNGKTTSTFMIDSIFRAANLSTGLIGTLYNKVKGTILPTANTTPDSILCQRLLKQMVSSGVTHVSMEVSSHAMVMDRVAGTHFSSGSITNFTPDHLDLHKDMEDYLLAKRGFFEMLPATGKAIVNLDCEDCIRIAQTTKAETIYYSLNNPEADVYLYDYQRRGSGGVVTAKVKKEKLKVPDELLYFYLGVAGKHNISNALLAAATALAVGIDSTAVARGLANFRGIFRRFETIYNGKYKVIDDATHNPANMDAVFSTIITENSRGLSVIYAIRGSRGVEINQSIAETLRTWIEKIKPNQVIITNCEDTANALDQVQPEEERVFHEELSGLNTDIRFESTLRDAINMALRTVRPGETLLFMGAHPMDEVSELFSEIAGVETNTLPRPPRFGFH